ncbi:MAG: GNAT family N-acetyltransferase [Georgfuchsia sp.]
MHVEFAVNSDIEPMADLLHELFTLESDFRPRREKQLAALRWLMVHPDHGRLFVLRDGNHVVGMANALISISTAEGGPVLILEDVIVAASHRGSGYGRLLVEHVLRWAAGAGMSRVTLLADKDNSAALSFYYKLGFEESAMVVRRKRP